jgi:glycerol-3-phosphate cytidylyltransferase-like family protein
LKVPSPSSLILPDPLLRFGSKLTVGVHSDEDYMDTKYDPKKDNKLMNKLITRSSAIAKLNFVDHVIPACPLTITPELLKEHKIHLVGISDEYVYKRDPVC